MDQGSTRAQRARNSHRHRRRCCHAIAWPRQAAGGRSAQEQRAPLRFTPGGFLRLPFRDPACRVAAECAGWDGGGPILRPRWSWCRSSCARVCRGCAAKRARAGRGFQFDAEGCGSFRCRANRSPSTQAAAACVRMTMSFGLPFSGTTFRCAAQQVPPLRGNAARRHEAMRRDDNSGRG